VIASERAPRVDYILITLSKLSPNSKRVCCDSSINASADGGVVTESAPKGR
jgi:hypothetical protein